ncbi:cytochrome P450 [Favolaschia claudopus]|uniref:Cytochrome P450 n=1 Tax=Favolaschia claudopus TaxID=2862362 RepID=A0AAW0B9M8_9AGAR
MLSPGIRFLLPILAIPCIYVLAGLIVSDLALLFPIFLFSFLVVFPILLAVYISLERLSQHLQAKSSGARLVPTVRGRWPGNLDILRDLRREWNVAYPFEVLHQALTAAGSNVVNLRIGWGDYIFTTEPEHIKLILATDFSNYVKGNALRDLMNSVLGTGVFNSDGEMWKFHRGATRPFFNRDRISDFEIFAHHADRAIERMKERLREGYAVNFQDLAGRFTMDSATSFLFGSCVDSLSAPLPYPHNHTPPPFPFSHPSPPEPDRADIFTSAFTAAITHISSRSV